MLHVAIYYYHHLHISSTTQQFINKWSQELDDVIDLWLHMRITHTYIVHVIIQICCIIKISQLA